MNGWVIGSLVLGLTLLVVGAELLVRGASRLAALLGISPLIVGLTVVAYGTSAPEMAVSILSNLNGQVDIAIGNVVGSNIFNVLCILGLSALVTPLVVSRQLIRLDVPIMIGVSCLMLLFSIDGTIGRGDGVVLFVGAIAYTLFLIRQGREEEVPGLGQLAEHEGRSGIWVKNLALIVGGIGMLVLGSQFLVDSATTIARAIGVSELVIGLTIVATGTSLPELATSIVASFKGERDIAVGNVVGSNIFNILAVLGVASAVSPQGIAVADSVMRFDGLVMLAVAIACLPIFFTGSVIARWEGVVFLGYYVAYTVYLILDSTNHAMLPMYSTVMFFFVMPLTVVTLATVTWQELRTSRR